MTILASITACWAAIFFIVTGNLIALVVALGLILFVMSKVSEA